MRSFTFAFFLFTLFTYMIDFSFQAKHLNFRATREWKIRGTQRLTPGLWLRIDFRASIREAKITSTNGPGDTELALGLTAKDSEGNEVDIEEIREILKKINPKKYLIREMESKKYHSVMEFKKDLSAFNIQFRSDLEILLDLIMNFRKYEFNKMVLANGQTSVVPKDEEVITGLVDLEFLVHQVDNAMEFVRLNGFVDVIHKCLNSTNSEIRSEALRLHGSATQIDPDVQIAAFEAGSISVLLKVLSSDKDEQVQARSLYALSCLVRQFPAAQFKMIIDGGLTVFASLFDDDTNDPLGLQLKVAILFQDLLLERQNTLLALIEEEKKYPATTKLRELRERQRQYNKINLNERLVEENWCSRISDWVVRQDLLVEFERSGDFAEDLSPLVSDLHDVINKMIDTVYVVSDICKSDFIYHSQLVELIDELKYIYSTLVFSEQDDDRLYGNIYSNLLSVLDIIQKKLERETLRDEFFREEQY